MEAAIFSRFGISGSSGNDSAAADSSGKGGSASVDPLKESEMILDGCKVRSIDEAGAAALACFKNLDILCLNQTTLTTISAFPQMENLKILELQDNHLNGSSGLERLAGKMPALEELSLAGNRIKNVSDLACLRSLESLRRLDLELNPLTQHPMYRKEVFDLLPNVVIVDNVNRKGEDVMDDDDDEEEEEEPRGADGQEEGGDQKSELKKFYETGFEEVDDDDDEDDVFQPGDEDDEEYDEDDSDEEGGDEEDEEEEEGDEEDQEDAPGDAGAADEKTAEQKGDEKNVSKRALGDGEQSEEGTPVKRRRKS